MSSFEGFMVGPTLGCITHLKTAHLGAGSALDELIPVKFESPTRPNAGSWISC